MRFNKEWLEDEETQKQLRELARWLLLVPLILLLLFGAVDAHGLFIYKLGS